MGNSLSSDSLLIDWMSYLRVAERRFINSQYGSHPSAVFTTSPSFNQSEQQPHASKDNYQSVETFQPDMFEVVKALGEGAFGQVSLVRHRLSKRPYALKLTRKASLLKQGHAHSMGREPYLLSRIQLAFVIRMYATCQDAQSICLLLEYAPRGDLFTLLRKRERFSESTARLIAAQVLLALEYLHQLRIAYRDLKPENLLLIEGRTNWVKLTDFGLAKHVLRRTYTVCGTPEYLAPEVISHRGYGLSCDWWSFGVLIFEMLYGVTPFLQSTVIQTYESIVLGRFRFPRDQHCRAVSSAAKSLISALLQVDFTHRSGCLFGGVQDIRSHVWFARLNWNTLFRLCLNEATAVTDDVSMDFTTKPDTTLSDCVASASSCLTFGVDF